MLIFGFISSEVYLVIDYQVDILVIPLWRICSLVFTIVRVKRSFKYSKLVMYVNPVAWNIPGLSSLVGLHGAWYAATILSLKRRGSIKQRLCSHLLVSIWWAISKPVPTFKRCDHMIWRSRCWISVAQSSIHQADTLVNPACEIGGLVIEW